MTTRTEILRLLADGEFHSGTDLGRCLGISRAAVWKGIRVLCNQGVDIHCVFGRGYKLATTVAPLARAAIKAELSVLGVQLPGQLEVLEQVDSTNRYLAQQALALVSGSACLAEVQHQGRGRRGRTWQATPYQNLLMSFAWRFETGPAGVAALSLAAGVAVVRALQQYGVTDVGLKWPNDVVWQGRKLAGLLAEVQGEAMGPSLVILGIGINVHLAPTDAAAIDQPWVDLETLRNAPVDRNRLAALLLVELKRACEQYAAAGFAPLRDDWQRLHVHHQQPVRLLLANETRHGWVDGVDDSGGLWLRETDGQRRLYHAGEISLRPER